MTRSLRSFAVLGPAILAALLLMAAAGCEHKAGTSPGDRDAAPALATAGYIGSDACRDCHASEFRLHQASRDNLTLRPLDQKLLGPLAPPSGPVPDSTIVLIRQGDAYRITRADREGDGAPVQLAFGSGKTGMTFAAMEENGDMVEISKSYFPSRHVWYITPGHEKRPREEVGLRSTPAEAARCLRCHGVPPGADSMALEPRFRGVGCESCHGPSAGHVEAMRSGHTSDLRLARLGELGGAKSIEVCSSCHRGKDAVNLQSEQAHMTNRFQAYGLTKSRCYLESQDKLSCVTCHNPHADAVTDVKQYEPACLSCHSGAPASAKTAQGRVCPVNPRTNCIACHMPERPVFKSANLPVQMADHFIRTYPSSKTIHR